MKTATPLFAILIIGLAGCNRSAPKVSVGLPERGYVWQRDWTPAVVDSVGEARTRMDGIVLLGAEINWINKQPEVAWSSIDWAALRALGESCSIALRVAPFSGKSGIDETAPRVLVDVTKSLLEQARAHGVKLQEFQLDFDCPQQDLRQYRAWLRVLRPVIHPVRFVITTLPAWLDEAEFVPLARETDGYVLQVHSVPMANGAAATVCDPHVARAWVAKAAQLGLPFSVALPTYRCAAGYDAAGKLLSVAMDSVQPKWPPETRVLEFAANPDEMADLVHEFQTARPPELRELLWYRIPVATDTRNWRWVTLSAVMSGRKPLHRINVVQEGENPIDVSIVNAGETDEQLDSVVKVTWSGRRLVAADALSGWSVSSQNDRAIFTIAAEHRIRLSPGATRKIGWLRFDEPTNLRLQLTKQNEAIR